MLGAYLRDVDVARAINCDSIGRFKLSYARNESAGWREFFDAPVIRIRDQNVSVGINGNSSRRIKFPLSGSSAALKHGNHTFRQGAKRRSWCAGSYFNRCSRQYVHALLELADVLVWDVEDVKRP